MNEAPYPLPPWTGLWDPRSEAEAGASPIEGACNVPLDEVAKRASELPPKGDVVRIAAQGRLAERAKAAIQAMGRIGLIAQANAEGVAKHYGESPDSSANAPPGARSSSLRPVARLWRPNSFLESVLTRLRSPGRALDLACGAGREALLMASWGWSVTAVDALTDALAIGRTLERRYAHPQAPEVEWMLAELEHAPCDLGGPYRLVTCFRFLHRPILERIVDLLEPKASFVFETYTVIHRDRFGKPRRERFVLQLGELPGLVPGLEIVEYEEGWHEGSHTARLWARKP